jgi:RNA polymerase sigma-70 factor (ECF subfamily)
MDGLISMLAADAVVTGDSGGAKPSWPRPITGRERVGRLFAALGLQLREAGGSIRLTGVNGQPGALFLAADGRLISVMALEIADGQVVAARSVISRRKLRHLGPLADLPALLDQVRAAGKADARPATPPAR